MTIEKETEFHRIAEKKGYTLKEIGERWSVGVRQMSRVANTPKQKDLDAINGIPSKNIARLSGD